MLIDYKERRDLTKCGKTFKIYTEVIKDLILALDIEPNMQQNLNETKININALSHVTFSPKVRGMRTSLGNIEEFKWLEEESSNLFPRQPFDGFYKNGDVTNDSQMISMERLENKGGISIENGELYTKQHFELWVGDIRIKTIYLEDDDYQKLQELNSLFKDFKKFKD